MTPKERLTRQARGQEVDRVPSIGGWIGGARALAELAGVDEAGYLADPFRAVMRAYHVLQVDGMVGPVVPASFERVRTGVVEESRYAGIEPEEILQHANELPDGEGEILASFDAAAEERRYRQHFENAFARWEGFVPIPNFWEIGGHFPLYHRFGYVAFLSACALYPEAVGKIWWAKSLYSRERARILLRLYREYDLVPVMFCGEDVCLNNGPMVAPEFLRRWYFPTVRMIIEPLVDAGIRLIHHCDGDVRPVIDDYLALGFSGLQGFQYELGIDPYALREKRSALGEELLIWAGLSVSRTLSLGTPEDVIEDVEYHLDYTDGGRGLFLFSSNVTGREVTAANLRAAYLQVKQWDPRQPRVATRRQWPWAWRHGV